MALVDTTWYTNFGDGSTTGYYAVTVRPQNTAVAAGILRRQFTAPAVGSERVYICIVAGTTANVTDATWVLTRGAKTTDGTATWQECTGQASLNGDLTNTATWAQVKAATPAVLGQIIKRSNGASYQICTTAGAMSASEPTFSDTAGVTTTDTTAVWTSLGVVGNFTGGQAPFARLASAFATNWYAAGNTVYVGDNHAESQGATINIVPAVGSVTTVAKIICHNRTGSYPPSSSDLRTGASVSTAGAFNLNINYGYPIYIYGVIFQCGVSGSGGSIILTGNNGWMYFDNCSMQIASTLGSSKLQTLSYGILTFNNTTMKFNNVGQYIDLETVNFTWANTGSVLAFGSLLPNNLMYAAAASNLNTVTLEALDLSQITGAIVNTSANASCGNFLIKDCKLNAATSIAAAAAWGLTVQFVRCDSSGTAYKSSRYQYEGTETTETSITRVGGAADPTGQAQSRKIVTTATSQWLRPFKAEPYAVWNATTGANVTVTVCGTVNAGALPDNDDIWVDVEYLTNVVAVVGDSQWDKVKLLMGFNGANGAGPGTLGMTDESSAAHGSGTSAGAVISTAQSVFGGSSLSTAAASGHLRFADHADWDFSNQPFTIEFRVYPTSTSTFGFLICQWFSVLSWVIYQDNATFKVNFSTDGSNNLVDLIGGTVVANTWSALCLDFDGSKYRLYQNGVMVASSTTVRNIFNSTNELVIGASQGGSFPFPGYIDELRITKGVARYASDSGYTVATAAFPRVATVVAGNIGKIVNTTKANVLSAPAAVASDSSTWNGGGSGAGWLPFKLVAVLSSPQPGMAGYIHARVRCAKPSSTFYVDPMVTLS